MHKITTAAEMLDGFFGADWAEEHLDADQLAEARQPYDAASLVSSEPARTVRLKVGPTGHVSPAHPAAPLGRHGEVRTLQVCGVPRGVSVAEVVRLYSATVDLTDSPSREYERLGVGRILR